MNPVAEQIDQAANVIKSYSDGQITWDQMVEVLKSVGWGTFGSSGGDWHVAASVPPPTGPLLTSVLAIASIKGYLSSVDSDRLYRELM